MAESTPIIRNEKQGATVKDAIEEVCNHRGYALRAVNVLTNHFHVVVSAQSKPEPIADAFKSYATRELRNTGLISNEFGRGRAEKVDDIFGSQSTFRVQSSMFYMGRAT